MERAEIDAGLPVIGSFIFWALPCLLTASYAITNPESAAVVKLGKGPKARAVFNYCGNSDE